MKFNNVIKEAIGQLGGEIGGHTFDIYLDFSWSTKDLKKQAFKNKTVKPTRNEFEDSFIKIKIPQLKKESKVMRLREALPELNTIIGKKIIDQSGILRLKKQILDFMLKYANKTVNASGAGKTAANPTFDAKIKMKQLRPGGPFVLSLVNGLEVISRNEKEIPNV